MKIRTTIGALYADNISFTRTGREFGDLITH